MERKVVLNVCAEDPEEMYFLFILITEFQSENLRSCWEVTRRLV